jgi:hypothetical protein
LDDGHTAAGRPLLWAVLTCLIAAITALVGYSVGGASGEGTTRAVAAPTPIAAPALLRLDEVYARAKAEGYRQAADGAYLRGRREGMAEGIRAARRAEARRREHPRLPFPGRGWYAVGVGEDGRTPATPPTPLAPGRSYRLCRSGAALCEKP